MSDNTCLIVACWKGDRRCQDPRVDSPDWYLNQQLERLHRIPNALRQVLFVHNDPCASATLVEPMPWNPSVAKGSVTAGDPPPMHMMTRPNVGISYGAFSAGYGHLRGKHDYYIFTEDDYLFTKPGWDQILARWLDDMGPVTGMICGLICPLHVPPGKRQPPDTHPGIAVWASPAAALEKVWDSCGSKLPHYENEPGRPTDYYLHEIHGQIALGQAFNKCGLRMADIGSRFRIPFHTVNGQIKVYYPEHPEALFMPVQCLEPVVPGAAPAERTPEGAAQGARCAGD